MIRFLSPGWLLAAVPVLVLAGAYLWRQRRRRAFAVRFSNVDLLRAVAPGGIGWLRRHAPAVALLVSLLILALAMARPSVDYQEPLERATVMLALDVSLSMQSDDVQPSRIVAAQQAAKDFVQQLPASFNIGLVAFAKSANVIVSPTKEHTAVVSAIDGLQLAEATATGEAVFTCLDAIAGVPSDGAQGAPPARIVLLSDGYRTFGRSIEEAAAAASTANVPVSTIAFGTDQGTVEINGTVQRVPVDRPALEQLAEATSGYFYEAATAEGLRQVYQDMGSSIGYRTKAREVGQWFVGFGLLFALAAAGMSLLWTSRLP
ncbi:MAG TPA: VWA domain-containing protein [Micromonosporaceae bacterium]